MKKKEKQEKNKNKNTRNGRRSRQRMMMRLIILLCSAAAVITVLIGIRAVTLRPYAAMVDGQEVCYFADEADAVKAGRQLLAALSPEDAEILVFNCDGRIVIGQSDSIYVDKSNIVTPAKAVEIITAYIDEMYDVDDSDGAENGDAAKVKDSKKSAAEDKEGSAESEEASGGKTDTDGSGDKTGTDKEGAAGGDKDGDAAGDGDDAADGRGAARRSGITTLSTKTEINKYDYKTEYIRDDTMLAGEKVIDNEGKKGKKEEFVQYVCTNGEIIERKVLKSKIIKKAVNRKIRKGTLGLPEGEDWRTYTGDPVYQNGEALMTTALQYLGAPYKYGGTSLETGIDCVAFVVQMYKMYGIKLPMSHHGLQNIGTGVSLDKAQKGDIICYARHVGIYLGDGQMVEATSKHGVRVGRVNEKRLVAVRRVVEGAN